MNERPPEVVSPYRGVCSCPRSAPVRSRMATLWYQPTQVHLEKRERAGDSELQMIWSLIGNGCSACCYKHDMGNGWFMKFWNTAVCIRCWQTALCVFFLSEIPLPNEQARMEIMKIHAAPIAKHGEIGVLILWDILDLLALFVFVWGTTGIGGLMRGMATLPQGNQELLVIRDKVGRPQVSLE